MRKIRGILAGFFENRCLAGFPWFWPAQHGRHPMAEARRLSRLAFGSEHGRVRRKLAQAFVTLAWPPAMLLNLWQVRWRLGSDRMLALKRVPGAVWAAIRHNILPSEYCAYGLWSADRKFNVDNYLYSNEAPRLFKVLNQPLEPDPINDKMAFYAMCETHSLPTPSILAAFAPEGTVLEFDSGQPPRRDLFVKASIGSGLAERFRWHNTFFESNRGSRLRPEDLSNYLAEKARSENRPLVVQPVLPNHPALGLASDDALATARLVTGCSIDGTVMPIFCFVLFGLPDRITAHSNYVTLVDIANGRLIPAPPHDTAAMSMYRYRQPSATYRCALPDWDLALHYVNGAHQACSNFAFIGWDVAFTSDGPMILEGNANWDAATYQTLHGEPLGVTEFADILENRLEGRKRELAKVRPPVRPYSDVRASRCESSIESATLRDIGVNEL